MFIVVGFKIKIDFTHDPMHIFKVEAKIAPLDIYTNRRVSYMQQTITDKAAGHRVLGQIGCLVILVSAFQIFTQYSLKSRFSY